MTMKGHFAGSLLHELGVLISVSLAISDVQVLVFFKESARSKAGSKVNRKSSSWLLVILRTFLSERKEARVEKTGESEFASSVLIRWVIVEGLVTVGS